MNYIRQIRELVGTHPIIMAGACVILIDGEGRLLLQQRTDNGLWGLPGGSMEPGEEMKEVAKRELFEEERYRKFPQNIFKHKTRTNILLTSCYLW
ncbi:hypothetical protein J53TS2_29610 [Paenibacillus sp. J53TS2]|uniref:NUDIX domain-containing protein n=1 Tax=Paenibacillus TaxID=44249 RepID=UPI001B19C445|nr:hypothetical protein J53TS2_29610 [Paenibacillus sp. J53TS2]